MSATSPELLQAARDALDPGQHDSVPSEPSGSAPDAPDAPDGPATLDVSAEEWVWALTVARDELGCRFFDWLSAVDYLDRGFAVVAHLVKLSGGLDQLLFRTWLPRQGATLASVSAVFAGAAWHERETHEMFGIEFTDHPNQAKLLLPEEFEGHPLRKDFVLASRVAKAWPGAKEPGESGEAAAKAPSRRRVSPPGVPSPDEWGPRRPGTASPANAASEPPSSSGEGSPEDVDG